MEEPGIVSDLLRFLDTLPAGFACGPREQMAVRELVLRLTAGGEVLDDSARLKTLVAPLVCGDKDQQSEFYDRFAEWIAGREVEESPVPLHKPSQRRWLAAAAVILLACTLLGGGIYVGRLLSPGLLPPAPPGVDDPDRHVVPTNTGDELLGFVRTPEGLPLSNATVWIPFGLDTPQFPKVITDSQGRFTIQLPSSQNNAAVTALAALLALGTAPPGAEGSAVFSPNGQRLATDTSAGATVWDAITGKKFSKYALWVSAGTWPSVPTAAYWRQRAATGVPRPGMRPRARQSLRCRDIRKASQA